MKKKIVVAGGTGKLGQLIIDALLQRGAEVHAPVRKGSDKGKLDQLERSGVKIHEADFATGAGLAEACAGASCVVSALQGLEDVIVDAQSALLQAAVAANVPRFIPSDFSVDFTKISSENRNFDLRRRFHERLNQAPVAATSIFNGAFADILGYNTPMLDLKKKTIGYWGNNPDWALDFTTMNDTAAFTAAATLDGSTPRSLHIASFQVSPAQLLELANRLTDAGFRLQPMGSLEAFAAYNKQQRAAQPESEKELYPRWQSGQYMHDQFSTHHETLDNNRYPELKWTTANEYIGGLLLKGVHAH